MAKTEKLPIIIKADSTLSPADAYTARRISARFRAGEIAMITLTKTRKGWTNRYAHKIGGLCANNLPGFENLDSHQSLKRLQWESGAHCEEIGAMVPGVGMVPIRIPKSLSYGECSQDDYEQTILVICRHVAEKYWPNLTPEQVREMAETMPDEV